MTPELLNIARDLCGLPDGDEDLVAEMWVSMLAESDRIYQSSDFYPENLDAFPMDDLETRFPTLIAKKILAMAVMWQIATDEMTLDEFARFGKKLD